MKHIILFLFVLLALISCVKEEEDSPLLSAPVITLKEESPIYKTKIGREITIAPIYENTDSETTFNWTIDGKSICTTSTLTFSADEAGRYFILISATNAGGTTEKEIRIDVFQLDVPTISIADADKGFKVLQVSELTITPIVDSFLETSYSWQINGEDISNELTCTLPTIELGEYQVRFATHNEDGDDEVTFKVEVCSPDQVDFNWTFLQTEYNMSAGRTIRIKPVDVNNALDAVYTWTVDNEQVQSGENDTYLFTSEQQGEHTVKVEMKNSYILATQTLKVNVCPPAGTYQRKISATSSASMNKVYEYLPAPGQFINENHNTTTMAEACTYAEERINQTAYVSLGGFGGYIIVGFDHSIVNDGDYNIAITGNAFDGSSEPGIVWVMQDENGDGLPNDTWYELRGSEYGKAETWQDYAVTYHKPTGIQLPTPWTDNHGQSGSIDYLGAFHRQDYYYPAWVKEKQYTLRGTRLKERNYDQSGNGTYWVNDSYEWGYADNFSAIDRLTDDDNYNAGPSDNHFKISHAVTFDGKDANLKYVDFIKVQVGVNSKSGWLGEISTEVFGIKDFNMLK